MNANETRALCANIAAFFPGKKQAPVQPETIGVWIQSMKDIPYDLGMKAVFVLGNTSAYPPTVAEFRQTCREISGGHDVMTGARAWDCLMRALGAGDRATAWNELDSDTRGILGGYNSFCAWGKLERAQLETVHRLAFIRQWETAAEIRRSRQSLPPGALPSLPALELVRVTTQDPADNNDDHEKTPPPDGWREFLRGRWRRFDGRRQEGK